MRRVYLLDTNILLRIFDRRAQEHSDCRKTVETLQTAGHRLVLAPQVVYEFWVVSTRPATERRGFGWKAAQARQAIDHLLGVFPLIHDTPAVFTEWCSIVSRHRIQGKRAHDMRLVAFMRAHRIPHFVTLNPRDFRGIVEDILIPGQSSDQA